MILHEQILEKFDIKIVGNIFGKALYFKDAETWKFCLANNYCTIDSLLDEFKRRQRSKKESLNKKIKFT